ncbi:MAG: hypothetical protein LBJ00_12785 [Planctomycetaceae bacterium]|nr:hypothetical protein [Planctomycetaceae bacterium]
MFLANSIFEISFETPTKADQTIATKQQRELYNIVLFVYYVSFAHALATQAIKIHGAEHANATM